MRILHIITRLIRGGAQENTLLSVIGQQEAGHDVRLLVGPTDGPEGTLVPDALAAGVDYLETPHLIRSVNPLRDIQAYYALRRAIRDYRPDVVHTHSSKAGILGRLAAWHERVPFVVHTIHGLPFHPYQSRLAYQLYLQSERFAARRCHHILSVCDTMSEKAAAGGVAPLSFFSTVYSGMRTEQFLHPDRPAAAYRDKLGLRPDDLVVGKVARLFELKGHDYLLDACAALAPDFPKLKLLLVGNGAWRERLEQKARALGIHDRIVWTGLLHPDEVGDAIQAMDLLAHCSLREGLARVLPQAYLCGKPVVSFDVDGAREVVINNQTGWLVPPADTGALCAALCEALGDLPHARALAENGRTLCRERFDWRTMVARLLEIYARGLGQSAAEPANNARPQMRRS